MKFSSPVRNLRTFSIAALTMAAFLMVFLGAMLAAAGGSWPSGARSPWGAQVRTLASSITVRGEVEAAWERAREAGAYTFDSDVVQQEIPLPTVQNIGKESKESQLRIEGEANLPDQQLNLHLWSQGGSVLDSESGLEVRVTRDGAMARQGDGAWEAIPSFTGLFAPEGDFLAYLAAASDIANAGQETRNDITFTRYTYTVDGPAFAAYLRDQMEQQLAAKGELPPGVQLGLADQYVNMRGNGELWVDGNGLPLRQLVNLSFPPRAGRGPPPGC
jgi:hypothetical protein